MTALATASRVLAWAAAPAGGPPSGRMDGAEMLLEPGPEVRAQLGELTRTTAARLGAGQAPLGDPGPVGLGAVLLAAAVGTHRDPRVARQIAQAVPSLELVGEPADSTGLPQPGWADAIARHGVAAPFVDPGMSGRAYPPGCDDLVDDLLASAPLTAVLVRPPRGQLRAQTTETQVGIARRMLDRPRGTSVLTSSLARPSRDADVLAWRAHLLAQLCTDYREVVLGVYLAARLRYGREWDELLSSSHTFGGYGSPPAAVWLWVPLAALDREDRTLLRAQPFFDGYRRAVELARPYVVARAS